MAATTRTTTTAIATCTRGRFTSCIAIATIARIGRRRRYRRLRARPAGGGYPRAMPMFAMLSTLGPGGWETLRERPERIREVTAEVEALGLTVHAQYALMGQYDFLN